jgi:hypothetical protein
LAEPAHCSEFGLGGLDDQWDLEMRFPTRVVGSVTVAAVSAALLLAAITPASAKVTKPPSSKLIVISAPTRAQKVAGVQPVTVKSTYPGTEAVWINFLKGQVPIETKVAVQDSVDPTLYHFDWDSRTWPYTSANISASAVANGAEIAVAKTKVAVKLVNPLMSGPALAKAGKTVRFGGKFLPAAQTAHLYQCWAEVLTPDDIATNCDTARVVNQHYSSTTVSVPVKMTKGTAPNLINLMVLTVTSGPDTVVLKSLPITVS